jgi:hypothetical protein
MDTQLEWGRSSELRCARDYLGLSLVEMAARLDMSRRSYQRMETGVSAIPESLWRVIDSVIDDFDSDVAALVTMASLRPEREPLVVQAFPDDSRWDRAVRARARRQVVFEVTSADDRAAQQEYREGTLR